MTVTGPASGDVLAAWRQSGAWRADPVRFAQLESLAARTADQPPAVRAVLERRLQDALDAFAQTVDKQACTPPAAPKPIPATCEPLAALNAHIRSVSPRPEQADPGELASVRRFRQAWDSGRTLDRLQQALARAPVNPGPLNSHALVVRSLALMGELSTDYLRRFLTVAETLQWLEAARTRPPSRRPRGRSTPSPSGRGSG